LARSTKSRGHDTQRPQKRGSGEGRSLTTTARGSSLQHQQERKIHQDTNSPAGDQITHRERCGKEKKGNEEGEQGRLHTGEVGPHGAHDVGVPEVAVALAEMHLLEVGLRRRHRRCLRGSPIWGGGGPVGLCFASTGEGRGRGRVGLGWGVRASGFGREGPDLTWQ